MFKLLQEKTNFTKTKKHLLFTSVADYGKIYATSFEMSFEMSRDAAHTYFIILFTKYEYHTSLLKNYHFNI